MPIPLIILIVLVVLLAGMSLYFTLVAIYPHTRKPEETYQLELQDHKFDEAKYQALPKEEFRLRSPYGYDLYGIYIPLDSARKTVVIVHGITYTLFGSVKYMDMFRKRGFNVLMFDNRFHGRSGGKNCTFGYYEKQDLKAMVDWAFERLGAGGKVGTMGESLGAATVLQNVSIDPRLSFVVADCPYSDLIQLFTYRLKEDYHLPPFPLLKISSWFSHFISGMSYEEVSPIQGIRQVSTPIFFAHGKDDDYIPPQMSVDMFNAKQTGVRKLYLAPNARHAQAYWKNPEEYDQKMGEFLGEVGI
jgi:dipeptidyl aminopeptidase/acylaminoacyl peptidase